MSSKVVSDEELIKAWKRYKSPTLVAKATGLSVRRVYDRRARLAAKGVNLGTEDVYGRKTLYAVDDGVRVHFERRRPLEVKNGQVVVFSDPHFYPDSRGTALAALLEVVKELKPAAVICGGDALDGTQIGRHEAVRGWHAPPSLVEQLTCMTESMTAIKKAAGKGATTLMALGNHDARFSRYIAANSPHMEDIGGTRLEDFIPSWPLSWTVEINGNTVIRHRNVGGMLHLQAQKAGCHYVHGHLHKLNVHAAAQYHGYLFSVDAGSLSDPYSDAFDYHEDGVPHVQGFAVLTYENGELLWPELCYIRNDQAYFRGARV